VAIVSNKVQITVKRVAFKDNYTIGRLAVDGVYVSDSIEDKVRVLKSVSDKVYGETAIPSGSYLGEVFFSKKFGYKVIRLFGVPFFEGIYIHKGNTAKDSHGCIIVGYNDKKGWLSRPTEALDKIISLVEDGGGQCLVTIK
jgi:hypothetical protein